MWKSCAFTSHLWCGIFWRRGKISCLRLPACLDIRSMYLHDASQVGLNIRRLFSWSVAGLAVVLTVRASGWLNFLYCLFLSLKNLWCAFFMPQSSSFFCAESVWAYLEVPRHRFCALQIILYFHKRTLPSVFSYGSKFLCSISSVVFLCILS